jgi:hypothetical protein
VLRAIGARLGAGREVIIVPGNHDVALVRPWLRANGVPAAIDAPLPLHATPALGRIASWLEPAGVRAHYPSVWLSPRVWATHGHYLDRHLLPESAYGIGHGLLGRVPRDGATPADYELAGGPTVTGVEAMISRLLPRPLMSLAEDVAEALRAATMPTIPHHRISPRLAPLAAMLLGVQMRRASIPALARVAQRLGADADWVIFGHVHRCGPLERDDPARWQSIEGRPKIANTGSWVYEPLLVHRATPPHPYWPGGAIMLEDGAQPQVMRLLDHLDAAALH